MKGCFIFELLFFGIYLIFVICTLEFQVKCKGT